MTAELATVQRHGISLPPEARTMGSLEAKEGREPAGSDHWFWGTIGPDDDDLPLPYLTEKGFDPELFELHMLKTREINTEEKTEANNLVSSDDEERLASNV
ncbi:MAG: hypothetical protein IAE85_13150 [Anaerolinea sp.]|nr:hypothetical protein [Anaerolinea sp.]